MKRVLDPEYPFKYFEEISRIPRKSFHELEIADYLVCFAEEKGLWYSRDAIGNVIIKKPGSPGKENEPAVILQAHMDMVCVREEGSSHDFLQDPVDWYLEDGWLKARGTTLGADDGAGVANILGILSEPDLVHPPLECVFTVQEEDGMGGANNLDYSLLSAKRMIGLDGIKEGTTVVSASGVIGGQIVKKLETAAGEATETAETAEYEIAVFGLVSGHGALGIGLGLANAIQVAGRLLYRLNQKFGIRLSFISGGTVAHVIPKECRAAFSVGQSIKEEEIIRFVRECADEVRQEYQETEPDIRISCRKARGSGSEAYAAGTGCEIYNAGTGREAHNTGSGGVFLTQKCSDEILAMLYLIPVGPYSRKQSDLTKVEASWNLSMAGLSDGELRLWYICRANYPGNVNELANKAAAFAKIFGAEYQERFHYSGFHVSEDSPLIRVWEEVYREKTGKQLEKLYLHAGLDAGPIFEGLNITDLIVVMPTVLDVHTTKERMDVESFSRTYQYLKDILAGI
ncbi:MAG TPA: beta-Ala-His dipeptidase [Anaerovoracaceae bacterium]|nr:beta-Ala-His dipeptidase [Anaerovoracaceae bacterium]